MTLGSLLTLFVVQSCADTKETGLTVKSFDGLADPDDTYLVPGIQAINEQVVNNDWYAVIHDNEHLDKPLLEGLKVFIQESRADVLVLLQRIGDTYYRCPRVFRKDVMLRKDSLLPERETGLEFDTVLNGFIREND